MCDSLPFLLCFLLSFQQQFNFFEECFQDGAMEIVVPPCPSQELRKRMYLFSFFSFLLFIIIFVHFSVVVYRTYTETQCISLVL